jgi:hypothetical protein
MGQQWKGEYQRDRESLFYGRARSVSEFASQLVGGGCYNRFRKSSWVEPAGKLTDTSFSQ